MRVAVACCLFSLLLGVAPAPLPPAGDRVGILAETWSCRTLLGAETHKAGARTGDQVDVRNDVHPPGDAAAYTLSDQYVFDPASNRWRAVLAAGSPIAIEAFAPPWTGAMWQLTGQQAGGTSARVTYELFSDRDMRRKIELQSGGEWTLTSAERCVRGGTAPPEDVCIASGSPARLISFAALDPRTIPPQTPDGTVEFVIHLDENSHVRSTTTVQSPSHFLTGAFLQSVRNAVFQTEVRDCRPVASDYRMTGTFSNNRFTLQY